MKVIIRTTQVLAMKKVRKRDERNAMKAYYHKFAVLLLLGGLYARYSCLAFASTLLKSTTGGADALARANAHSHEN